MFIYLLMYIMRGSESMSNRIIKKIAEVTLTTLATVGLIAIISVTAYLMKRDTSGGTAVAGTAWV